MSAATAERNSARKIARIEELIWLTEVYGYSTARAQAELGIADKTLRSYLEYAAEHPELRDVVLKSTYGGGDDDECEEELATA